MSIIKMTEASIVYTDVNPDKSISGGSYDLDLNNDGTADYTIIQVSLLLNQVSILPNGSNEVVADPVNAVALDINWAINSTETFSSDQADVYSYMVNPTGFSDKYLGLKLKVNNQVYYGWVRLDITSTGSSFSIKDYAYENIANTTILAGNKGMSAMGENVFDPPISVYYFDKQIMIEASRNILDHENVMIINSLGQMMTSMNIVLEQNNRKEINLRDLSPGVYFVSFHFSEGSLTKKILVL